MGTLLTADRRAQLEARLAASIAALAVANATYLTLLGRYNKEYRLDTADGLMQSAKLQNINDLRKQIRDLEADIDSLQKQLAGRGITNMVLRRYT